MSSKQDLRKRKEGNGNTAVAEPVKPPQEKPGSLARAVVQTSASEWVLILSLIFGGCCSNAWTLELATNQLPSSGTLITFAQFLMTTISCLPSHVYVPQGSLLPRLRPRAVPFYRWLVQVALYFSTSLLNNMAFAYDIPMSVHIVFRSGGLVINMILGYTVQKRRYTPLQVLSVLLVTAGVISSTLSSSSSSSSFSDDKGEASSNYITGVLLLFLALVLTGLMGLWQERTFRDYGNQNWRESLFYSHLLSLPMFALRGRKLAHEIVEANATPLWHFAGLQVPSFYPPLLLNVATQLLCINGVNRLTAKVSSLTVTLVLVVRKALSLVISVIILSSSPGSSGLWIGASAVLLGTVGYSIAGTKTTKRKE